MAGLGESSVPAEFHEQIRELVAVTRESPSYQAQQYQTLDSTGQNEGSTANFISPVGNSSGEHCANAIDLPQPFPCGISGSNDNWPRGRDPPLSHGLWAQPEKFGNNTLAPALPETVNEGTQSDFNICDWTPQQGELFPPYSEASMDFGFDRRHDAPPAFMYRDVTNQRSNPSLQDSQLHVRRIHGAQERGWRGYEN